MSYAVLVVDDEKEIRAIMQKFFESNGLTVYAAANGVEGVAVFHEHASEISAVVTDIQMPQMDGVQMIHELLRLKPSLRVVVVSSDIPIGYSPPPTVKLLNKPCSLNELLQSIRIQ
jgi:CheY-like chemotaxis protein